MYKKSLNNLEQLNIEIKNEFFYLEKLDAPLLRGVNLLLQSIDTKGLKLTLDISLYSSTRFTPSLPLF